MPIRTLRLPEIEDDKLFEHLKSKANPIRSENNYKVWSDDEIKYMIHVYGANPQYINMLFVSKDSPTGFTDI
jgi:hypothetical protein